MRIPVRAVFGAIAAICAALVAYAIFYMQEELGLEPCPMCVLSRYCFIVIGSVSLVAAIHGPRGVMLKVYSAIVMLFATAGMAISVRHSWLQHNPPKFESCGTDLDFLITNLPFVDAFPKIFAGTGSCTKVDWRFIGLSIPEWAGIWFAVFFATALWIAFLRRAK